MKKIFLSICFGLFVVAQVRAETREFSSIEAAQANATARNKEVLQQAGKPEALPQNDDEMLQFMRERLEVVDITQLSEGDRFDKSSSFSKVDDEVPQKSFLEKIYDEAIARVSGNQPAEDIELNQTQYYSLQEENQAGNDSAEQMPIININLPNGDNLRAPAYEHIPVFSSQIEVLPNRMLKVYENVTVIANGEKVKNGLIRFIKKTAPSRKNKVQITLNEVRINGTVVPYKLIEDNEHYILRPERQFKLPEGVYVFEFRYFVDRYLWDYGDFYEFYWDLTGGQFNLLVNRAIAAVKMPGREPATKRFVLTGKRGNLKDENAVVLQGENNTLGFMNLFPLMTGESMYIFMTVPKIDFLPVRTGQKLLQVIDDYGDVILSAMYLLTVLTASLLSWFYIQNRLKFKNVNLSSPLLVRSLWRGAPDVRSVGCVLLDLFRRNIIDIQKRENDVVLVRKSAHAKNISKLERKVLNLLFSKKDSIYKPSAGTVANRLQQIVTCYALSGVKKLGFKLSLMYILFNILILAVLETSLALWNENSMLPGIFGLTDILWLAAAGCCAAFGGKWLRKGLTGILAFVFMFMAAAVMYVYVSGSALVLLSAGVLAVIIFSIRISKQDALLKNAVKSAYNLRDFLRLQKENIGNGKNFITQQANIFVLDLENEYPENPKIKNVHRIAEVISILKKMYS